LPRTEIDAFSVNYQVTQGRRQAGDADELTTAHTPNAAII